MTKKILVSGGSGYIGSHTVVELLKKGFEPVIADNYSNSNPKIPELIGRITGKVPITETIDFCDRKALDSLFARHPEIAGVIHFAAYKAVGESVENPLKYYHNNLFSLINLLECMQSYSCRHLVFSSSCTVYGQPDQLPVTETAPVQQAMSPYGNTKQISEEIILDTVKASSLQAISLRYFNPIGAHESGLIGELPIGVPGNLVPFITQTAIGKRDRLKVFGNDYPTPDGTAIRDYIYVCDLALAHIAALDRLMHHDQPHRHEVFNLGTGNGNSVLEVIRAFEKVSNVKLAWEFAPRRAGDVVEVWADTSLANVKLNWKARAGLEHMVATAWVWERNLAAGIMNQ